jgi:hypothetical protein
LEAGGFWAMVGRTAKKANKRNGRFRKRLVERFVMT